MNAGPTELLTLRLGLIAIMFVFLAVIALTMRGSLASAARKPGKPALAQQSWRLQILAPGDSGLQRGLAFPLAGKMLVGRDGRSGVVIPAVSVSARHASIEWVPNGWRLVDLGSTNGTFVNGQRVDDAGAILGGGERITIGRVELQLVRG